MPVLTARVGKNAPLFADILSLYLPRGRVLDATWGRGNFWTTVDLSPYHLVTMDMEMPAQVRGDFAHLPFRDQVFDGAVLDPPYAGHGSGRTIHESITKTYNLKPGTSTAHIKAFYSQGMAECARVLRPGGILVVKCQDSIESGKQQRMEHWVSRVASDLGLTDEDTLVLVQSGRPLMRHPYQKHARKNHSYFRVFRR